MFASPLSHRGVALIMTLLLLIILAVLVGQLSYSTKIDYYTAKNQTDEVQNHYALLSAVNQAIAYLQLDAMQEKENQEAYDALTDEWCKPRELIVGTTRVSYVIHDENSKFNLLTLIQEPRKNQGDQSSDGQHDPDGQQNPDGQQKPKIEILTPAEQFDRLVDILQENLKVVNAKSLREAIVSWLKDKAGKNELEGPFANNAPMLSVKELLLVKDITPAILYGEKPKDIVDLVSGQAQNFPGLMPFVTVWSDGAININTASRRMLQTMSDKIDAAQADRIIAYRERDGNMGEKQIFKKEDELKKVEGMTSEQESETIFPRVKDLITVRSHYFSIHAEAFTGRMSKRMHVVVYRSGKRIYKLFCDEE